MTNIIQYLKKIGSGMDISIVYDYFTPSNKHHYTHYVVI